MVITLQGDCLDILPNLEPESVQCVVTSPPYWGLRDYGTATWEGGDEGCDHLESQGDPSLIQESSNGTRNIQYRSFCKVCSARRIDSQLGLESTPAEYIANMVRVFREVRRVLKDDGVLWVNIGDSYAGGNTGNTGRNDATKTSGMGGTFGGGQRTSFNCKHNLKPKDLCMIPARLAIALCDDGWYLRSEIVWHKPNPMPESVTDRPTKAHEMVYLLSKRPTYFYDADAIKESVSDKSTWGHPYPDKAARAGQTTNGTGKSTLCIKPEDGHRNKRSVWTVATQAYRESHFATFPENLIKPMIMAGSRVGDVVLDPFAGSGTVGEVALGTGRKSVLIELNPKYCEMINDRTNVTVGMF